MLGRPTPSPAERIATALEGNTEALRRFELLNERQSIAVGDFVVARGYLGEVEEEITSTFGYRSLRVVFLAERPLPDLAGDWFRARDVVRLFSRAAMTKDVAAAVGGSEALERAGGAGAELRASVVEAWNLGLRDEVRSRMLPSPSPRSSK
jgi:hypothetical protein